jgi:hypothetical protein
MITLRLTYAAGRKLAWSAQRATPDGSRLDFATGLFVAVPMLPTRPLVAESGLFNGRYHDSYQPAVGALWDGYLVVAIHDLTDPENPLCLGESGVDCLNGVSYQQYPF